MQTILNNKKSTYGNPYCYHTVKIDEITNRTATEVELPVKIISHLANSSSVFGTGGNRYLKAQIYIGGAWSEEITLKTTSQSWSGTTEHTTPVILTISDLNSTDTELTDIKFKVKSGASDQSCGLNETSCSNIEIPMGHEVPSDITFSMTEKNPLLVSAGISNDVIVEHLSKKRFNVNYTLHDNADVLRTGIYNNIYPYTTTNFTIVDTDELYFDLDCSQFDFVKDDNDNTKIPIVARIIDNYETQGLSSSLQNPSLFSFIPYINPYIIENSTTANRIGQTSGQVGLTVKGGFYKGDVGNVIQSSNYKPTIAYRAWEYGNTDGASQSEENPILGIIPAANVTVNNDGTFEVDNYDIGSSNDQDTNWFDPEKVYRILVSVEDTFAGYITTEPLSVPVGESIWDELPDRVDFKKITVKDREVFPIELMHATPTASVTYSSTSDTKFTLEENINVGNKFSISNGGILIGTDVSIIKISAQMWFSTGFNAGDAYRTCIYKNNTKVIEAGGRVQNANAYESCSIVNKIIEVEEGDIIYLYGRNATAGRGNSSAGEDTTYLTIEKIS